MRFLPAWFPGAWFARHGKSGFICFALAIEGFYEFLDLWFAEFKPVIREMWREGMKEVQSKMVSPFTCYLDF